MTTENTAAIENDEQLEVAAEIFANMLQDAETMIERHRRIMQQQIDDITLATGSMIKDAMLNICASAGFNNEQLKKMTAIKKAHLDEFGHAEFKKADDTEGGSQD